MDSRSESPSASAAATRRPISPEAQRPCSSRHRSQERSQNTSSWLPNAAPPDKMASGTAMRREQSRVARELAAKSIHRFPRSPVAVFSELFDDLETVRVTNRPVEIEGPEAPRAKSPKRATGFPYPNHGTRLRKTRSPATLPASLPAKPISARYWRSVAAMVLMRKGQLLENQAGSHTQDTTNKQLVRNIPPGQDSQSRLRARKKCGPTTPLLTRHDTLGEPRGDRAKWDNTKTTLSDKADRE